MPTDRYVIRARIPLKGSSRKDSFLLMIGHATVVNAKVGGHAILCTIGAVPLNWNGEFMLYPVEQKPDGD